MVILPLSSARVSNLMQTSVATQNIDSTQAQLTNVEQELTTGKQVNQPSDNPSSAAIIQQLQKTLDYSTQYATNINQGTNQLNEVDSSLGDVTTLLTQAQSIASANASSTTSAESRRQAATVVDSIYNQILTIANKQYAGTYLFGADDATQAPYNTSSGGVEFVGSTTTLKNTFQQGTNLGFQVSAADVFGGESASVSAGASYAPQIQATDLVSNLAGTTGQGVTLGSIQIGNGTTTATVNLSGASSVGDIVADINASGLAGISAQLTNNGIKIVSSGGATVSVNEVGNGSVAADLGILQATPLAANSTIAGANLGSKLTDFTPLTSLFNGAGLDLSGITIATDTTTKTVSLAGATDVEDVLNKINDSGAGVRASINANGTGIDVTNNTQGQSIKISENGGGTAAQLGIRSYTPATSVASLNSGKGVSAPAGNQFSITTADGSVIDISLSNLSDIQSVVNQIDAQSNGKVTAGFANHANGLTLTDNTTGGETLTVASLNGTTTAADLGLTTAAVNGSITGTDVNPVGVPGIFSDLKALADSLRSNSTIGITDAAENLQTDSQTVTDQNATVGARVDELTNRQTDLSTLTLSNKTLLSSFQDVDYTTAVTQYQTLQTGLQASLEVTAKSLNLSLLNYIG